MRPRRRLIQTFSLGQNFRLVMSREGITFKDIARRAKVSQATSYRMVERTPLMVTEQLIRIGRILGFTERQIREKVREDRLVVKKPYSKKEKLYQLVSEMLDLFDSK